MLGYRPHSSRGGAAALDPLVPANHFYRHLARTLDLAFVGDLVATCYASRGRPSIDPVVFFKLHLIMFFEGIRSERHLMRTIADRVSLRWYLALRERRPTFRQGRRSNGGAYAQDQP